MNKNLTNTILFHFQYIMMRLATQLSVTKVSEPNKIQTFEYWPWMNYVLGGHTAFGSKVTLSIVTSRSPRTYNNLLSFNFYHYSPHTPTHRWELRTVFENAQEFLVRNNEVTNSIIKYMARKSWKAGRSSRKSGILEGSFSGWRDFIFFTWQVINYRKFYCLGKKWPFFPAPDQM